MGLPPKGEPRVPYSAARGLRQRSGRIVELTAGLGGRRNEARALLDLFDDEEVFGVLRALGLRMADEDGRHELMIFGTVVRFARLARDFGRQLQAFQRVTDL